MSDDEIRGLIRKAQGQGLILVETTLCEELLAARAEIATLRADRDAALEREMRAVRERDKADLMLRELGQEHHEALRQIAGINADRDAAVAKAVGVERERAAKLADDCAVFWRSRRSLADAIRRGE